MINIEIIGSPINKIIIKGHADYAENGKDIVCAGVSSIVTGTINALEQITKKKPCFVIKEGFSEVEFKNDDEEQIIANVMKVQLETIENSYKKYIKIKYSQTEV